jgi:TolB-like protein/Tfp pilus assembly protein PilF
MPSLLSELKRRNVLRVAAGYALVAWIVIEAGSVLMPTFGAPEWAFQVYVIVVLAGFLLALILAWIFELTPDGVKLERDVDPSESITQKTGRKFDFAFVFLLVIALAISVTLNITGMRDSGKPDATTASRTSIAVLPFTSRSIEPENALFADGIHDDLLTRLANISALKVISRTSVMEYRDTTKNLRQIAEELGVDTVLEGAVQRVGDRVRVNAQLIDAQTDEHVWGKTYDYVLSAENIFAIQSDISEEISNALKAALTDNERSRLAIIPTKSLAAYSAFTEGRSDLYQRKLETTVSAREHFEKAVELDPDFAAAYSGLADSIVLLFINHRSIQMEEAFSLAQEALDKALLLDPELADAYASLGLLKTTVWGQEQRTGTENVQAEEAFEKALAISPNHARATMWFASLRASERKYDESIELYRRSLEIDPLARIPYANLPGLYAQKGHNAEALAFWLDGADIYPDWPTVYASITVHLQGLGRNDEAIAWAIKARELSTDPLNGLNIIVTYIQLGDVDGAMSIMSGLNLEPTHPLAEVGAGVAAFFFGHYDVALKELEAVISNNESAAQFMYGLVAQAALLTGDYDKAYRYTLRGDPALTDLDELVIDPFNTDDVVRLAFIFQQRGEHDEADNLLRRALVVLRASPRLGMAGYGVRDVQILSLQGRTTEALHFLQQAIDDGFRGSLFFDGWRLEDDPYLVSIRDDPKFELMHSQIREFNDEMLENVRKAELFDTWDELRARARVETL